MITMKKNFMAFALIMEVFTGKAQAGVELIDLNVGCPSGQLLVYVQNQCPHGSIGCQESPPEPTCFCATAPKPKPTPGCTFPRFCN